jgi:hypothetical protein
MNRKLKVFGTTYLEDSLTIAGISLAGFPTDRATRYVSEIDLSDLYF